MYRVHVIVEEGPDRGKEINIPEEGARFGRSSKNDVVLADPLLSRFHCRFSFQDDGRLCITDLGSSNETLLNDVATQSAALSPGDRVVIGDTCLKILHNGVAETPVADAKSVPIAAIPSAGAPSPPTNVDLDFSSVTDRQRAPTGGGQRFFLWGFATVAIVLMVVLVLRPQKPPPPAPPIVPPPVGQPTRSDRLEIEYEKVSASPDNIFRYAMLLDAKGILSIDLNDLEGGRHIHKESKQPIERDVLDSLRRDLEGTGFFELQDRYAGLPRDSMHDTWDLSITIGSRVHRTTVANRLEPEIFKNARDFIEEFGKNELALPAIALPTARLIELAEEAVQRGQKLYNERTVRHGNLFRAIKHFRETEFLLETVEPKPESYRLALAARAECERELQTKYEHFLFLAEKAISLRDWEVSAANLRIIQELIPERTDSRYKKTYAKLIDVERRLMDE